MTPALESFPSLVRASAVVQRPALCYHLSILPDVTITEPLSYRVTGRMRLSKAAGSIEVNNSLTLTGIPEAAFDYVLGTRSALEWIVDQYRLEEDENGTVTSDPNDPGNEQYVVQLIERVTTVSIETMGLIRELPAELDFVASNAGRRRSLTL